MYIGGSTVSTRQDADYLDLRHAGVLLKPYKLYGPTARDSYMIKRAFRLSTC